MSFNSKMVRLKEGTRVEECYYYNEFQFQNGAIKRKVVPKTDPGKTGFQFQNGAIKRTIQKHDKLHIGSFNSKMVRLKAYTQKRLPAPGSCFNSKMVRLKASTNQLPTMKSIRFQFQNGAIKRSISGVTPTTNKHVSIPKWCD